MRRTPGEDPGSSSRLQPSSFRPNVGFFRASSVTGPFCETLSFHRSCFQQQNNSSKRREQQAEPFRRLGLRGGRGGPFPAGVGFFGLAGFSNAEVVRDGVELEYAVAFRVTAGSELPGSAAGRVHEP